MKLSECLEPRHIVTGIEAGSAGEAIERMVDALFPEEEAAGSGVSRRAILEPLLTRERSQTTALGMGIACPHTRLAEFEGFFVSIGLSRKGIPFDSPDGKPVHVILLLISSLSKPYLQLRAMRGLVQFLEKGSNMEYIKEASPEEIWKALDDSGLEISDQVLARDLMRRVEVTVSPDMSIGEVAHLMHGHNLSNLPVVDAEGNYIGFVSSIHLFRVGVPQFFQNLKTVSFVRNLDPFEKYFAARHIIKVKDIQEPGGSIDSDATLLEIVFQIAVKGYQNIHVLDGGRLVGVIDNYRLIDRVLTL